MSRDDVEGKEPAEPGSVEEDRALDQQISRYLRLGLPAATLIGAVVAGVLQGPPAVVLVLCAGALASVIALFWASLRTLVGETPLSGADAYALGAPRAEEEKKRAVLRALKDLEFERSVGKINDEDYQALRAKYRAEGKRLIQVLEEEAEPRRRKVEDLVARRLFQEGLVEAPPEPYRGAEPQAKAAKKKKGKAGEAKPAAKPAAKVEAQPKVETSSDKGETSSEKDGAATVCAQCHTRNDADAAFCKKCGTRLTDDEHEGDAGSGVEDVPSLEQRS